MAIFDWIISVNHREMLCMRTVNNCIFFENSLVYLHIIWYDTFRRCSILVGVAIFQEGPKNPLKGTSMKSLVSAFYAQFRVDAGG